MNFKNVFKVSVNMSDVLKILIAQTKIQYAEKGNAKLAKLLKNVDLIMNVMMENVRNPSAVKIVNVKRGKFAQEMNAKTGVLQDRVER